MLDRPLEEIELLFLAESGGDLNALSGLYTKSATIIEDEPADTGDTGDTGGSDDTNDPAPQSSAPEESSGVMAVFKKFLNAILSIFGLGGDDEAPTPPPMAASNARVEMLLTDILPAIDSPASEQDSPEDAEEDTPVLELL
ncbi:MAG: hypothetical protein HKM96_06895 [Boseongicola sp.]|nr:hypothetical protein [Boseongicola sp.]